MPNSGWAAMSSSVRAIRSQTLITFLPRHCQSALRVIFVSVSSKAHDGRLKVEEVCSSLGVSDQYDPIFRARKEHPLNMVVLLRVSAFNKPSGLHTLVGVRLGCSLAPLHVACSGQRITSSGDSNMATSRVNLARQTEGDLMRQKLLKLFTPIIIAIHPSRHYIPDETEPRWAMSLGAITRTDDELRALRVRYAWPCAALQTPLLGYDMGNEAVARREIL